jgi:5-methylcytosine-specific restriction endonuclease McrA
MVTRREHNRRSGRKSLRERLGRGVADSIRERDRYLCVYCGAVELSPAERHHLDHIIPKSQGGKDEPTNLVVACQRCNTARHALSLDDWAVFALAAYDVTFDPEEVRAQARKPLPKQEPKQRKR